MPVNDERRASHFSASTATPMAFDYDTPATMPYKIGPTRLDSQFQENYELHGSDRWGSTAPFERTPYVPKYMQVNYIDGSTDPKWSSREFSWTRKIEVFLYWKSADSKFHLLAF